MAQKPNAESQKKDRKRNYNPSNEKCNEDKLEQTNRQKRERKMVKSGRRKKEEERREG